MEQSRKWILEGKSYAIRFKSPEFPPQFDDIVYGTLKQTSRARKGLAALNKQENLVLLKSDGLPTYHLANVVDDHHMKISHVIRGTEWIPSTSQHVALYSAFGWKPPQFGHVSLLLNEASQKLSKRDGDISVDTIRKNNDLYPEALINFVTLLGWSCPRKNEVMSKEELIENVRINVPACLSY